MKKNVYKAILSTISFVFLCNMSITSIYPLVILSVLLILFTMNDVKNSKYANTCACIFGIFALLSLFQVGKYEDILDAHNIYISITKMIFIYLGTYYFVNVIVSLFFSFLDKINVKKKNNFSSNKILIISFVTLVVLYFPVWLMEYPSNISPDTINQINQIVNNIFTNHHPFAHTLWLKLLMSFGSDINTRIGVAALLQMFLNAAVFSFINYQIYKKTNNTIISILLLVFYGLFSFNAFMSITLIKDVTHAMITCLLIVLLINYFDCIEKRNKTLLLIVISIFSLMFCLFRSNGYYAFVILIIVSIVYSMKRKEYGLLISFAISFVVATIIKGPIYYLLGISSPSFVESLSIPIQQISLVIRNGKTLTTYETEMIGKIVDISKISDSYDVFLSDPIKNLINNYGNVSYLSANRLEYLKIWLEIGVKYPIEYIRGWVNQVSTFFAPTYYGTSIFWSVWENDLGIVASPMITAEISTVLHNLAYTQHNIPLFGCLHYPSVYTWVLIVMLFYSIKNKNYENMLLISILLGIFITLLISCPYNICFRYYYAVVCSTPIIVIYGLLGKNQNE